MKLKSNTGLGQRERHLGFCFPNILLNNSIPLELSHKSNIGLATNKMLLYKYLKVKVNFLPFVSCN